MRVEELGRRREWACAAPPTQVVGTEAKAVRVACGQGELANGGEGCHREQQRKQADGVGAETLRVRARPVLALVDQALALGAQAAARLAPRRHCHERRQLLGRAPCWRDGGGEVRNKNQDNFRAYPDRGEGVAAEGGAEARAAHTHGSNTLQ